MAPCEVDLSGEHNAAGTDGLSHGFEAAQGPRGRERRGKGKRQVRRGKSEDTL